jgi:RNA 2',3'-cyclic 3'-phosphodiesterase
MLGGKPTRPARKTTDLAPKLLRLFVAIDIPPDVKRAIILTIEGLQHTLATPSLRWIRSEGIHATIKFLGATPEDRLPEIKQALARCAETAAPFDLAPLGVGSFGGRNLRVVWIGLGGDGGALAGLAECVEGSLEPLGFVRERRAFNAHMTLARVRDDATSADRARVHDALTHFEAPRFPTLRVSEFVLMQSILGQGGARYQQLASFPLAGA